MSNVSELRKDLVDKVVELGVGMDLLSHPAFVPALSEIDSLIGQMNIHSPEDVRVVERDGVISFEYSTSAKDKYSFELRASKDKVSCVRVEEPHSFVGNSGSVVRQKNAVEKVVKVDEYGNVTVTTNGGHLDNIECDNEHYNMSSSVEVCGYDRNGVMYERENRHYASRKAKGYIHRVGANELLSYSRWAPEYGKWNDGYATRVLLRREMLDTARIVFEDKEDGETYYGVVPLSQQHGLSKMFIANGYNTYPVPEVNIHPLMESEIEDMISRETDPRIGEGLRNYSNGRTTYSYSSSGNGQNSNSPRIM